MNRCKRVDFQFLVYEVDMVLPVVVYGCETWLLPLREERRLRSFNLLKPNDIYRVSQEEKT